MNQNGTKCESLKIKLGPLWSLFWKMSYYFLEGPWITSSYWKTGGAFVVLFDLLSSTTFSGIWLSEVLVWVLKISFGFIIAGAGTTETGPTLGFKCMRWAVLTLLLDRHLSLHIFLLLSLIYMLYVNIRCLLSYLAELTLIIENCQLHLCWYRNRVFIEM